MEKLGRFLGAFLSVMLFMGIYSIAEEITLTTYYPAPYGAYEELTVTGNVGIGTTTPGAKLVLADPGAVQLRLCPGINGADADAYIRIAGQSEDLTEGLNLWYDTSVGDIYFDNVWAAGADSNPALRFRTKAAGTAVNALTITHGGDVGIGTTEPAAKLTIWGGSRTALYAASETNCVEVHGTSGSAIGVSSYGNYIGVYGSGGTYDFYAGGAGTNYGPFTGAHEVKLDSGFPKGARKGLIVSVTGETQVRTLNGNEISISSTLPTVKLSNSANDKTVLGVLVSEANLPDGHWYKPKEGERFGTVNALGEGRALVTNINGNINAGDYITTSSVAGYGQKQDDDLLHSYTLGKAIENVDWDNVNDTIEFQGKVYKYYLIGIVYTSG